MLLQLSCSGDNSPSVPDLESYDMQYDIKAIHDEFCVQLCDQMDLWLESNLTNDQIFDNSFDLLARTNLADELDMSLLQIDSLHNKLGLTVDNFGSFGEDVKNLLSDVERDFIDDLLEAYEPLTNEAEILAMLDNKYNYWIQYLEPFKVYVAIEVAKSSFVFWQTNVPTCIYNLENGNSISKRYDPCKARIAGADVTGSIYGAFTGGIVGAIGGAIAGTGGSAVVAILTGGC